MLKTLFASLHIERSLFCVVLYPYAHGNRLHLIFVLPHVTGEKRARTKIIDESCAKNKQAFFCRQITQLQYKCFINCLNCLNQDYLLLDVIASRANGRLVASWRFQFPFLFVFFGIGFIQVHGRNHGCRNPSTKVATGAPHCRSFGRDGRVLPVKKQ